MGASFEFIKKQYMRFETVKIKWALRNIILTQQ